MACRVLLAVRVARTQTAKESRAGRPGRSCRSAAGPTLNPTSTQFGQVTTVALNQMRFFTFGARMTF
jgi:hypothetical protein